MAEPSSPEAISRKPLPPPSPPKASGGNTKENVATDARKPLPQIPIPTMGRMLGAPMSPVKINVQPEDFPPKASSAVVEGGIGHARQFSEESEQVDTETFEPLELPRTPVIEDIPFRSDFTRHNGERIPQAQSAVIEDFPTKPDSIDYNGIQASQPKPVVIEDVPFKAKFTRREVDQIQEPQSAVISSTGSSTSGSPSDGSIVIQTAPPSFEYPEGAEEESSDSTQPSVPRLQYHHQPSFSDGDNLGRASSAQNTILPTGDVIAAGQAINRHLTPTSQMNRHTPIQRPASAYSDLGPRGRSPGLPGSPIYGARAPSAQSRGSHDSRPMSYVDLANISYPQAPPAPISMDNSQLRAVVGSNASLLSMGQTLDMYRKNVKKLHDSETQYAFAIFLIQAAQESGLGQEEDTPADRKSSPKSGTRDLESPYIDKQQASPRELVNEAKHILQKLSDRSYPFAQYYLADGYASGLFNKGKEDYGTAFPLFISASKHGHAESGYRAALCYEFGWGCRKDAAKAIQFYRQSASKNHPGAMTRLGRACLSGELGLNRYREGLKWLKRATESADLQYNAAPYHLGLLYETGYGDDIFQDEVYAAQLFTQAADLGHAESCYRLGDAYEHGKLSCPRDPALSVHFYTGAAQRGHAAAMMALCAWYMVGAEPVLDKDENEAYEWARQAAECGLTKAQYAVGYFTEMGIGTRRDPLEANVWYVKAADSGDERAKHRLAAIRAAASGGMPMDVGPPRSGKVKKTGAEKGQSDKDCAIM